MRQPPFDDLGVVVLPADYQLSVLQLQDGWPLRGEDLGLLKLNVVLKNSFCRDRSTRFMKMERRKEKGGERGRRRGESEMREREREREREAESERVSEGGSIISHNSIVSLFH